MKICNILKLDYSHPDDIDLFTGGMLETQLHGGVVGPTFACVIGKQFHLLRHCDRYWYENANPLIRFTEGKHIPLILVRYSFNPSLHEFCFFLLFCFCFAFNICLSGKYMKMF